MTATKSFLVFSGSNDRAVLAFLRALALCGQSAYIVARTHRDLVLRTDYRADVVLVRETSELTLATFVECVREVREVGGARNLVILPSSEYFNHFLLRHRSEIEGLGCEVPLVSAETYELLTNKRSAATLFASAGIDVPADLPAPERALLPMVAKPIRNTDGRGLILYPALLRTPRDIAEFTATHVEGDFFFQEFVLGESLYLFVYVSRDRRYVLTWSQRNVLQQPQGKSMLLAVAHDLHQMPMAKRLLEVLDSVGFTGLGMIELIHDGQRHVFVEMNPRPWGPIQFCLDQGPPLLQAFIGECLHGDPHRYVGVAVERQRPYYFWCGGLLDTIASRGKPDWHAETLSWLKLVSIGLRNDVYLRSDSWRCFLYEIEQLTRKALHGDRHKG